MSRGAQAVLEAFDQLPPAEREEVFQALLRRLALSDHESFTDEELLSAADTVFSAYDEEESKQ
jgi:hypothetical protein